MRFIHTAEARRFLVVPTTLGRSNLALKATPEVLLHLRMNFLDIGSVSNSCAQRCFISTGLRYSAEKVAKEFHAPFQHRDGNKGRPNKHTYYRH